jgi:hypothetical protein
MKNLVLMLVFLICKLSLCAQFTDRYWAFGDSAAIDFKNVNNPVPSMSILRSRGTCASICDSSGNLLFYGGTPLLSEWIGGSTSCCFSFISNKNHQIMDNGNKLFGRLWYNEMIIVPKPNDSNLFYVFTVGVVPPNSGLKYSIVDLSQNNGLGKVILKNMSLATDTLTDGITMTRHGNGRDWWVITKNWSYSPTYRNDIQITLVTPNGPNLFAKQNIGTSNTNASSTLLKFNKNGTHLYAVDFDGIIDRFDFDRCTGVLSNPVNFLAKGSGYSKFLGFEISPNESRIYVTSAYKGASQDSSFLFQFDLDTANFINSVDTLGVFVSPSITGFLEVGPDDKIYLASTWAGPDSSIYYVYPTCFDYLYCYETLNQFNNNISVINYPDSAGAACNFQPYSFNLGNHKTYWGLPNNPNYELGKWVGSVCDTLGTVGIEESLLVQPNLSLFYHTEWKIAFINAKGLKGKQYKLEIFNLAGQLVLEENGKLDSEYYTSDVALTSVGNGMYVVRLSTDKEVLTGKFVKF